jgi:hypothetical protein
MKRYLGLGAALLTAAAITGTVHAQAVVEDPGYCAQYYPNSNCTNYGPGNPLYPGTFRPSGSPAAYRGPYAAAPPAMVHHRYRHRHHVQ